MERKFFPAQNVFSPEVATILKSAHQQGTQVTMLHLFFSLYQDQNVADFMQNHGLGIDQARAILSTLPIVMEAGPSDRAPLSISDPYPQDWRTFQVRKVLMQADGLGLCEGQQLFTTRHLLRSMLMEDTGPVTRLIERAGLKREVLIQQLAVPFPTPQE